MSEPFARRTAIEEDVGEDPILYIVRLYVQYLQGLFNFMPANHFHWEPDQEVSEIIIRGEAPIDLRTAGKHPALTVVMGPIQYLNLGIDNMVSYSSSTNRRVRSDLMSGTLVVYSLAESDIIATQLGHIVAHHTRAHQRILEGEGGFHQIARPAPSINSPSPPGALVVGDPAGLVMVQTNIPFSFQWTWQTETNRQSPQFRSLRMITEKRRASDFNYTSPSRLERVELAMSVTPVFVRRISGSSASRPVTVAVTDGIRRFQKTSLLPFGDEE